MNEYTDYIYSLVYQTEEKERPGLSLLAAHKEPLPLRLEFMCMASYVNINIY